MLFIIVSKLFLDISTTKIAYIFMDNTYVLHQ